MNLKRYSSGVIAAALITAVGLVPTAGASTMASHTAKAVAQKTLKISNTTLTAQAGSTIAVKVTGGSGTGALSYSATGSVCSINAISGLLGAPAAGTCKVTVTKAASTGYLAATSAAVTFTFTPGPLTISNATLAGNVGVPLIVTTTGGLGTGAVTFTVTGTGCTIVAATGTLIDSATGSCVVTAHKAKSSKGAAQTSATKTFTFTVGDTATPSAPDVATLTSMTGVDGAGVNDTANAVTNYIGQYYQPNDSQYMTYITAGATVSMTWTVTGSNGQPLANVPVTLVDNLGYGDNTGISWSQTSLNLNPCQTNATCNTNGGGAGGELGGVLAGTTNSSGQVTFTLNNTNSATGLTADPTSAQLATTTEAETLEGANTYPWTRALLVVGSDLVSASPNTTVNQTTALVDFIVLPTTPTGTTPSATWTPPTASSGGGTGGGSSHALPVSSLTSLTGEVASTTQIDDTVNGQAEFLAQYYNTGDHWYQYYVKAGSSITMTWQVNDANGNPLADQAVSLMDNLAYTTFKKGNATWSGTGAAGLAVMGNNGNPEGGTMSGTTNSSGQVSFTITNTNTVTGACPASMTALPTSQKADPAATNEGTYPFTDFVLQIGSDVFTAGTTAGVTQGTDRVDTIIVPTSCN